MDSETAQIGRDRLLRVFQYLKALDEHRNPVKRQLGEQLWSLWLKDLPDHPSVHRGVPLTIESPGLAVSEERLSAQAQGPDFILKIARPRLTTPPAPPAALEGWLEANSEDPFQEVSALESNKETAPGTGRVRFAADSKR